MNPPSILFPSQADTSATLLRPLNRFEWTGLTKYAISASAMEITTQDTSDIPAQLANNYIQIDSEMMWVVSVNNTGAEKKLTVERAAGGSTAATHAASVLIENVFAAEYHNQLRLAIEQIQQYVLANTPTPITQSINASPFTYQYSGQMGYNYTLIIAAKTQDGLSKQVKSFNVSHWNDAVNVPQYFEGMLYDIGNAIDIQIANLQANSSLFDIVVTGANSGEMKISVDKKVVIF